jgi:hypothetical protein
MLTRQFDRSVQTFSFRLSASFFACSSEMPPRRFKAKRSVGQHRHRSVKKLHPDDWLFPFAIFRDKTACAALNPSTSYVARFLRFAFASAALLPLR